MKKSQAIGIARGEHDSPITVEVQYSLQRASANIVLAGPGCSPPYPAMTLNLIEPDAVASLEEIRAALAMAGITRDGDAVICIDLDSVPAA